MKFAFQQEGKLKMFTMKIYDNEEGMFDTVDDAIKYMEESNFEKEVSVYAIDSNKAYKTVLELFKTIKEYNKGKPLDDKILPSNPFGFRGILGCLGVQVYSITLGKYNDNRECIALFTGYNDRVLDTSVEKARIVPGVKAMSSLALMGSMMRQ